MTTKIAVFIDGDAVVMRQHGDTLFAEAKKFGELLEKRIYCLEHHYDYWKQVGIRNRASVDLVDNIAKDATDFRIYGEAVKMALTNAAISTYVICASDAHFCHIAAALRDLGKRVIGIGGGNALRDHVDQYLELEAIVPLEDAKSDHEAQQYEQTEIRHRGKISLATVLNDVFRQHEAYRWSSDGWVQLGPFIKTLKERHPDLYASWKKHGGKVLDVLRRYEELTGRIEIEERIGGFIQIRLTPKGQTLQRTRDPEPPTVPCHGEGDIQVA